MAVKQVTSNIGRIIFREPYLPPPVTPLYVFFAVFVIGGGLALFIYSVGQHDLPLAFGLSLISIGAAECLPVDRIRLAGVLRILGAILVIVAFWLFLVT